MDALYFRVSSDRQTTENQFQEVVAEWFKLNGWPLTGTLDELHGLCQCIQEIPAATAANPDRKVFKADTAAVAKLAERCIYVEQGRSSKVGSTRPLFEQMKRDAQLKRFDRLLVWKVSRLGRDMREVLNTVYDLADLGITVYPVKSQTGPITSAMGKLLWSILAWFAEMENVERAEAINAGLKRARDAGTALGRPKRVFDRDKARALAEKGWTPYRIAKELKVPETTIRRAVK